MTGAVGGGRLWRRLGCVRASPAKKDAGVRLRDRVELAIRLVQQERCRQGEPWWLATQLVGVAVAGYGCVVHFDTAPQGQQACRFVLPVAVDDGPASKEDGAAVTAAIDLDQALRELVWTGEWDPGRVHVL